VGTLYIPVEALRPRSGLREQVSDRLLTAIFENRFVAGEHLIVGRLSKMLGVSPTPVRESLVELEGLGVVNLVPNRGAEVKPFGLSQLHEMAQVRRVLESEAARCACGKIPAEQIQALHAELKDLDKLKSTDERDQRARDADTKLHGMLADNCGNARLASEIRRYLLLFRALRNVSHVRDSWNHYRRSNDVPEHLRVVEALMAGNSDHCGQEMNLHIRSVEKTLAEVLFNQEGYDPIR